MLIQFNEMQIKSILNTKNNSDLLHALKNVEETNPYYKELFDAFMKNSKNTSYLIELLEFYLSSNTHQSYHKKLVATLLSALKNPEHIEQFACIIDRYKYDNFSITKFTNVIISRTKENVYLVNLLMNNNCINKDVVFSEIENRNYSFLNLTRFLNTLKNCESKLRNRIIDYALYRKHLNIKIDIDLKNISELFALLDEKDRSKLLEYFYNFEPSQLITIFREINGFLREESKKDYLLHVIKKTEESSLLISCLGYNEVIDKKIIHKLITNNKIIKEHEDIILLMTNLKKCKSEFSSSQLADIISLIQINVLNMDEIIDLKLSLANETSFENILLIRDKETKKYTHNYSLDDLFHYYMETSDINPDKLARIITDNEENAAFIDINRERIMILYDKLSDKEKANFARFVARYSSYNTNYYLSFLIDNIDIIRRILDLKEYNFKNENILQKLGLLYDYFDKVNPNVLDVYHDEEAIRWCNYIINYLAKIIAKKDVNTNIFEDFKLHLVNIKMKKNHEYSYRDASAIEYDNEVFINDIIALAQIYVSSNAEVVKSENESLASTEEEILEAARKNEKVIESKKIVLLNFLGYIGKIYKININVSKEKIASSFNNPVKMKGNDIINLLIRIVPKYLDRQKTIQNKLLTDYPISEKEEAIIITGYINQIAKTTAVDFEWRKEDFENIKPSTVDKLTNYNGPTVLEIAERREKEKQKNNSLIRKLFKKQKK